MRIGTTLVGTICKIVQNGIILERDGKRFLLLATATGESSEDQRTFVSRLQIGNTLSVVVLRYVGDDDIYVVSLADGSSTEN